MRIVGKRTDAGTRIRTTDFLITNEALYQLSYTGIFGICGGGEYTASLKLRLAAFVADADQYFDAFLFGAFR